MRSPSRSPCCSACFSSGWLASRPIQELLAGHADRRPSRHRSPRPGRWRRSMTVRVVEKRGPPDRARDRGQRPYRSRARRTAEGRDGRAGGRDASGRGLAGRGRYLDRGARPARARAGSGRCRPRWRSASWSTTPRASWGRSSSSRRPGRRGAGDAGGRPRRPPPGRLDLAHTTIEAPFKGVVERAHGRGRRLRRPGRPGGRGDRAGPVPGRRRRARDDRRPASPSASPGRPAGRWADRRGPIRFVATHGRTPTPGPSASSSRCANPTAAARRHERPDRRARAADHRRIASRPRSSCSPTTAPSASRPSTPKGIVRFHPARIVKAETDAVWLAGLPERLRVITTGQGFVAEGEKVRVEVVPEGPRRPPRVTRRCRHESPDRGLLRPQPRRRRGPASDRPLGCRWSPARSPRRPIPTSSCRSSTSR